MLLFFSWSFEHQVSSLTFLKLTQSYPAHKRPKTASSPPFQEASHYALHILCANIFWAFSGLCTVLLSNCNWISWGSSEIFSGSVISCLPSSSDSKASTHKAGDLGSIPGLRRSPGEENGNPFQYPCLENPMDRGPWGAAVCGVAKSWTWLSD